MNKYYWVRQKLENRPLGEWEIAEAGTGGWWYINRDFVDICFFEIGPEIKPPC